MLANFQVLVVFFWVVILLGSDPRGRALHFKLAPASLHLSLSISLFPTLLLPLPLSSSSTHVFPHRWMVREAAWLLIALCSRVRRSQRPSFHHGRSSSSFASIFSLFPPSSLIDDLFFHAVPSPVSLRPSTSFFFSRMCLLYSTFIVFYCRILLLLSHFSLPPSTFLL